ncbi:hypothetical protein R5R35_008639 [Gryllus longicercus]|uniref:Netrin n=1 Tax=Gryllus longicercus TaxID=2509291 RepID=A0AAN9YWV2_9ORTH
MLLLATVALALAAAAAAAAAEAAAPTLMPAPHDVLPPDFFQGPQGAARAGDPCYAEGRARRCVPDFVNAAFGRAVHASSTCGVRAPQRVCDPGGGGGGGGCVLCDAGAPRRRHPPDLLTDLNNPSDVTCWRSEPLPPARPGAGPDNVTLTLSLGKAYEITYVSLQFCPRAPPPESLAIFKSADFGETWQPFQFYSAECRKVYGRPNRATITKANEQEALCTDAHRLSGAGGGGAGARVAFSTLEGRPSAADLDHSPVLQDWVTATDIKVVFHRLQLPPFSDAPPAPPPPPPPPAPPPEGKGAPKGGKAPKGAKGAGAAANALPPAPPGLAAAPAAAAAAAAPPALHYAAADLAVGGRCKCNGHAARCVAGASGQLQCDCRHNTAGRDCERCRPFHFDRPWGRATARDARECKACNCNQHARRCRFNMELFKLSGRASGGVCLKCRHFTAGRHCHYCKEGYYRDPTKPITHHKACKPCDCHPIGASGRTCNQTSGQCPCKDGVAGATCDRCAKGFQQSRSHIAPCVRVPKMPNVMMAVAGVGRTGHEDECGKCSINTRRLNLLKYCRRDYALLARVAGRATERSGGGGGGGGGGPWVRVAANVQRVFKRGADSRLRRGALPLWVPARDVACKCPALRPNRLYLILGREFESQEASGSEAPRPRPGLTVGRRSIVIEWKDEWLRRMRRFQQRARHCR